MKVTIPKEEVSVREDFSLLAHASNLEFPKSPEQWPTQIELSGVTFDRRWATKAGASYRSKSVSNVLFIENN